MRSLILIFALLLPLSAISADYYWVGGSGNWSDLSHWVTLSGGNVQHSQIPTADDNVYFDQNSFTAPGQQVNIALDLIFCKTLDFRGLTQSMRFVGLKGSTIRVYGSLYLNPQVDFGFDGTIEFRSNDAGNEIEMSGETPFMLDFLGNGAWTFLTGAEVDSLIRIQFGNVNLGNGQFQCERFEVFSRAAVDLSLGNARILITGNPDRGIETNWQWRESLHFEGPGDINVTPGNSEFVLSGAQSTLGILQIAGLALSTVTLGRIGGQHKIYTRWAGNFTINKLELLGNTVVEGEFRIDEIVFEGGQIVEFQSNTTQRIGLMASRSNCAKYLFLRASEGGRQAVINASNGAQNLSFAVIKDIAVSGATHAADNAINLGGNSGWVFQDKVSEQFYWIGGSGVWSDAGHWSNSSGGPVSGCLPSAADNVIFDENSFTADNQSVTIDVPAAYCKNMDWRMLDQNVLLDNVTLENRTSIRVFGSLWFSNMLTNNFFGDFFFEGPGASLEIQSAGIEFKDPVYFDSPNGEWTLKDNFDVEDTLFFNAGTLNTDDNEMEFFRFYSLTSADRVWNLGNSNIRVVNNPHPNRAFWGSNIQINAENFTLNSGTSSILCFNSTDFYLYNDGTLPFHKIFFYGGGNITTTTDWSNLTVTAQTAEFYGNGSFSGEMALDSLLLSAAKGYRFSINSNVIVQELEANGNCSGFPYLYGFPRNVQGMITSNSASIDVSNVSLESIVAAGTAAFTASNSIDEGGNDGWTFTSASARTLYWVGGPGVWFDEQHWSLTSGGAGGACVPTIIDDVFFDANSFANTFEQVDLLGSSGVVCHDITFAGALMSTGISNGEIKVSGSLSLQPNLNFNPWGVIFTSNDAENTIRTGGNLISWTNFMGSCLWILEDEYSTRFIEIYQGTLVTNDQLVNTGRLIMNDYPADLDRRLELGNSLIRIGNIYDVFGELFVNTRNLTVDPGNSTIEFIQPYSEIYNRGELKLIFNRVIFTSNIGLSHISQNENSSFQFKYLQFNNDAYIENSNEMDSLLLASGKTYTLEQSETQLINNYMLARGTNCTPIGLISDLPGTRAIIRSANMEVVADFVQMQDQGTAGAANFFAGNNSTDINNNQGWVFGSPPEFVETGFLGPDRVLCLNNDVILDAYNYNPSETYVWNTNSIDSAIVISAPGKYWVDVNFANGCALTDTVVILEPQDFQPSLGGDTILCEAETLLLDANLDLQGASYYWQDSTFGPQFEVSEAGMYKVSVTLAGCQAFDSIEVSYVALPSFSIDNDPDLCNGDTLFLDVTIPTASYLWSDGSVGSTFEIVADGEYWVIIEANNCTASDTLNVTFVPSPNFDFGPDTVLCDGTDLQLNPDVPTATFNWQDASTDPVFTVLQSGLYWVDVTRSGCTFRDSIRVDYKPLPVIELGADTSLCIGTSIAFNFSEPGVSYLWNDGLTDGIRIIDIEGNYTLTGTLNGCSLNDDITIGFEPPPSPFFGADVTLCEGDVHRVNLMESGVSYFLEGVIVANPFEIVASGVYQVEAFKLNCMITDTIEAVFNPLPVFSLGEDLHGCPGDIISITPDDPDFYTWNDGTTVTSLTTTLAGDFWAERTIDGCTFRDSLRVGFSEVLDVDLGQDTIICAQSIWLLDAFHPSAVGYIWSTGATDTEIMVDMPGNYSVEITDGDCLFSDDITITHRECHYFSRYVPNVFSPNGDGVNDILNVYIESGIQIQQFSFAIFGRWGNLIFETDNPAEGWDGRMRGKEMSIGVYVYALKIEYIDDDGPGTFMEGGDVTLMTN